MIKAFALGAIVCGLLFVYGFFLTDRIRMTTRADSATQMSVVVTLPSVTPEYRWLSVYGCSADIDENGHALCNYLWERESTQEIRQDQRQYVFPWRPVPRGTIQISSMVFDANQKILARGQTVVLR